MPSQSSSLVQALPGSPLVHLSATQNGFLHSWGEPQAAPSSPLLQPALPAAVEQNPPGQSAALSQGAPKLPIEHTCALPTQKKPGRQSLLLAQGLPTKPSVQTPRLPASPAPVVGAQCSPRAQSLGCKQALPSSPPLQLPT